MSGDGQPSSSQSVKGAHHGIFIRLDGLSPTSSRISPHYLCGNPYFIVFCAASCCVLRANTRAPKQHSSSSSVAEAAIDTQHPEVGRNILGCFLGLWKRSPPVSSELLRSFFDVIPEPNKAASALKCWKLVDCPQVLKACWLNVEDLNMGGLDWKRVRSTKYLVAFVFLLLIQLQNV